MATGLDTAASIAGIISLCVTLFNGCIKGISIISEARQMGRSVERLSIMLEWEQHRFLRWGERAGLCDTCVPNNKLNWSLIHELLSHLHEDLTDAKILKDKYSLEAADSQTDNINASSSASPSKHPEPRSSLLGRSWQYATPVMRKSRAQIIQQKATTFEKLKWTELDQDKVRRLLAYVSYFNNALHDLLDDAHQDIIMHTMSLLMRDMIARSAGGEDLKIVEAFLQEEAVADTTALQSASKVKQVRLLLGLDKKSFETSGLPTERPKLLHLTYEKLTAVQAIDPSHKWQVAEYKLAKKDIHARVLLEWRTVEKSIETKIKRRIMELALLMSTTTNNTSYSLRCLGFVERIMSHQQTKYAFVFEVADLHENTDQHTDLIPVTLQSLLLYRTKPSLSKRLQHALAISEALLQMHTSGWLHKGICADAVLFLQQETLDDPRNITRGPYLIGYEFARNTIEETETMPFNEKQILYRHPSLQDATNVIPGFRKRYDLYSLGCVLLEIVLWTSLENILCTPSEDPASPTSYNAKSLNQLEHDRHERMMKRKATLHDPQSAANLLDQVAFAGGDQLRRVVELCFFPLAPKSEDSDNDDDETNAFESMEMSVDTQVAIVDILRNLHENV